MATGARVATILRAGVPSSRVLVTPARQRINAADVAPDRLVLTLQMMQDALHMVTGAVRSNPHSAPCIVRGVSFTSGTACYVRHTLGRAWTGWWICRHYPNGSTSATIPPETAYPPGSDATTILPLLPGFTGMVDLCITGE